MSKHIRFYLNMFMILGVVGETIMENDNTINEELLVNQVMSGLRILTQIDQTSLLFQITVIVSFVYVYLRV